MRSHSFLQIYLHFFRPKSGSTLLYSRKKVRYRRDGYCWKKRKDGKTTREDHMKLKVQGIEVSLFYNRNLECLKISKWKHSMNHANVFVRFCSSAFTVVTFIPQSYQHFTGGVTGFFR